MRMGRCCDTQELNSGKIEVAAILRDYFGAYLEMPYNNAKALPIYPEKSSANSILLTSTTGQVEFCFYEPQREQLMLQRKMLYNFY